MEKSFSFSFPLKHKVVRDLKIVTEHVGDLYVEAVGYEHPNAPKADVYERYAVDIETVQWDGTNIKDVLTVTGGLEEIEEAAIREFANLQTA